VKFRVCVIVEVMEPVRVRDVYEDVESHSEDDACERAAARVKDRLEREGKVVKTRVDEDPELLA